MQQMSAEAPCEILHKALPRKRHRRDCQRYNDPGRRPCRRHERAFSVRDCDAKNIQAGRLHRAEGRKICGMLPRETPVIAFPRVMLRGLRNGQASADAAIVAAGRTGGLRSDASGFSMRRPLSGPLSGELVASNELRAGQAPGSRSQNGGLRRGGSRLIPARPGAIASAPACPCRYHAARDRVRLGMRRQSIKHRDARRRGTVAARPSLRGKRSAIPDSDH